MTPVEICENTSHDGLVVNLHINRHTSISWILEINGHQNNVQDAEHDKENDKQSKPEGKVDLVTEPESEMISKLGYLAHSYSVRELDVYIVLRRNQFFLPTLPSRCTCLTA